MRGSGRVWCASCGRPVSRSRRSPGTWELTRGPWGGWVDRDTAARQLGDGSLSETEPNTQKFEVEVPVGPSGTVPVVTITGGCSGPFPGFAEFTVT